VGDWSTQDSFNFIVIEQTKSWCYNFRASEIDEEEGQGTTEAWASLGYRDGQIRFWIHFRWKLLARGQVEDLDEMSRSWYSW
jgi:hypothetical protein